MNRMHVHRTWLRKYRLASGLSQTEVARALSLKSPASVSRWERDARSLSTVHVLELSALYHRLANDLLRPEYLEARERVNHRVCALGLKPHL